MKKTKNIILSLFILLLSIGGYGQLENANWYMGEHTGLNFQETGTGWITNVLYDGETTEYIVPSIIGGSYTTTPLLFHILFPSV